MSKIFISDQSASDLTCDIANAFRAAGLDVCLVSGKSRENRLRADIPVKKVARYDRSSSLRRIKTWLAGTWGIWRTLRRARDAELFIISNPPLAPLLPLFLRNKFSLLVWDIWPDALVHTRTLSPRHPMVRFWAWLNRRVFPRAETIFTISEGLADALARYAPRERIRVVPLWADTEFLKPLPKAENRFVREQNLAGKFVVLYSGNIGNTHRVECLVDVAAALQSSEPDIVFVIIGEGGKKELVRRRIEETGAKNVLLLPFQPREMLPHSLASADIGVVTLDASASQVSVPSKTYSMLAVGAPLLCLAGENSELSSLVKTHGVGQVFPAEKTQEIARWILSLKNDPAKQKKLSAAARETSLLFTPDNAKRFVATLHPELFGAVPAGTAPVPTD